MTGARERAGATSERRASLPGERPRSGSRPPAAPGQGDSVQRNPYLACPETGSQGRRGRCGAKASWSRASAPRRPRGNRPRKVPVARSASGFRFFGLFENQHRRPGRRAPRNPRQRLGTPAQGHGVARSGGGSAGHGRIEERGVCNGLGLCARPTCPLPDGDDLRILERIVRQLLADSRSVRHLEVAPFAT